VSSDSLRAFISDSTARLDARGARSSFIDLSGSSFVRINGCPVDDVIKRINLGTRRTVGKSYSSRRVISIIEVAIQSLDQSRLERYIFMTMSSIFSQSSKLDISEIRNLEIRNQFRTIRPPSSPGSISSRLETRSAQLPRRSRNRKPSAILFVQ